MYLFTCVRVCACVDMRGKVSVWLEGQEVNVEYLPESLPTLPLVTWSLLESGAP